MSYASITDLKMRIDKNILAQLTDDDNLGVPIETVLTESLDAGTRYVNNALPSYVMNDTGFIKEVEILKAYEVLLQRKGYFDEANNINLSVRDLIKSVILKQKESAFPIRNSETRFYSDRRAVSVEEWDTAFGLTNE